MKKNFLPFLIVSALIGSFFVSSCNKGKVNSSESTHEIITGNLSFEIPALPTNGEYDSIIAFSFKTNMDSIIKGFSSKYDFNSIRTVNLRSCMLTLTDKDNNNNFRNFHTVNIGISSKSNPIFYRIAAATDIVDTTAYFLNVPTLYNPNLASYFRNDSIAYRLYGNMRRPTTKALRCNATLTYDMTLRD